MSNRGRWDTCISHRSDATTVFIREYFSTGDRSALFIGGAGFDPRATVVASALAATGVKRRAVVLRETRRDPARNLLDSADRNLAVMRQCFGADVIPTEIAIFESDDAIVGGRNAVSAASKFNYDGITDIIVDLSALSIGVSFPIVNFLVRRARCNLHIFVSHQPSLDEQIVASTNETATHIHGFRGGFNTDETSSAAKLWLPQLCKGRRDAFERIHKAIDPDETCPILPFPSQNPRTGDILCEYYMDEFENSWMVDARNLIYAAEDDPLDLYRIILRLQDARTPVFKQYGGSLIVLSPLGSKVMALGSLMAALERDLPLYYLESISYETPTAVLTVPSSTSLVHVWLEGLIYPPHRSPCAGG